MKIIDTYKEHDSITDYKVDLKPNKFGNLFIMFGNFTIYRTVDKLGFNFYDIDAVVEQEAVFNKEEFRQLINDMNKLLEDS